MKEDFTLTVSVDIGTTKLVATAARRYASGHIEVLGVERIASTGVKRGLIVNLEETTHGIQKVIDALENRLSIRVTEVYVGVSGYHVNIQQNRCNKYVNENSTVSVFDMKLLKEDGARVAVEPWEEILHVIPQDFYVNGELVEGEPVGMNGHRLDGVFNVLVSKKNSLENIYKCVESAGYSVLGVVYEPLASAYGVLTKEEMEAGAVVVDIGGGTTDIALFYEGVARYTAVIPLGGNIITSDIKEGCSVLQKQAESLKVNFGSAMESAIEEDSVVAIPNLEGWEPKEISFRSLSCIIQARMEEIIEYVLAHIEASGFYDKLGAGIVVTGGGSLLKSIVPLFKLKTGLDAKLGVPGRWLPQDLVTHTEQAFYTTSIGLLISGAVFCNKKVVTQKTLFADEEMGEIIPEKSVKSKRTSKGKSSSSKGDKVTQAPLRFLDNLKNSLVEMFDPNDTEMN